MAAVNKTKVYLYTRTLSSSFLCSNISGSVTSPWDVTAWSKLFDAVSQLVPAFRHWSVLLMFPDGTCKLCEAHEEDRYLKGKIIDASMRDLQSRGSIRYLGESEVSEEELQNVVNVLNETERVYLLTCQNCQSWVKDLCQLLNIRNEESSSLERGLSCPIIDAAYLAVSRAIRELS